jgi:hypothetical protein
MFKNLFKCSFSTSKDKCLVTLSQNLISNILEKKEYVHLIGELYYMKYSDLVNLLDEDNKKKAFWINIYNSFARIKLANEKEKKLFPKLIFFEKKDIEISNLKLSLDDIEHKILRKSQMKYFKGYYSRFIFLDKWEKDLRLYYRDPRINFALNFCSKGCPIVKPYGLDIETTLNHSTRNFLYSESDFNKITNMMDTSKIFDWYNGDFQGRLGVIKLHKEYSIIPYHLDEKYIKIDFKEFNWELDNI